MINREQAEKLQEAINLLEEAHKVLEVLHAGAVDESDRAGLWAISENVGDLIVRVSCGLPAYFEDGEEEEDAE